MRIYTRHPDFAAGPSRVKIHAPAGYLVAASAPLVVRHLGAAQVVTVEAASIDAIDAGLTLDEAHTLLTDGLTKAELVTLGEDLGLTLSDSSLKADLLASIRTHLEGLA